MHLTRVEVLSGALSARADDDGRARLVRQHVAELDAERAAGQLHAPPEKAQHGAPASVVAAKLPEPQRVPHHIGMEELPELRHVPTCKGVAAVPKQLPVVSRAIHDPRFHDGLLC